MSDETEVNELVKESREEFDLGSTLRGGGRRSDTITVYTDEETGDELGDARDEEIKNDFGITIRTERVQEGVLGEIDKIQDDPEQADRLRELRERAVELRETLKKTSLTIALRAVPPVIAKGAKRRAKETLGIKGKPSEDKLEDLQEVYLAHLLSDTIVSVTRGTGEQVGKRNYEQCKEIVDYLPTPELNRLDEKLGEVQFKNAFGEKVTEDADF